MSEAFAYAAHALILLALPPLLIGIIGRVKAFVAGRAGPTVVQPYRDLLRLLRKSAVLSRTTTWVFAAGPIVALVSTLLAGCLLPLASAHPVLAFEGDLVLFAYLLGLGRFFTIVAALDTGSSFEGMGASREAAFGALSEPAIFLALVTLVVATGQLSLAAIFRELAAMPSTNPALWLVAAVLGAVLLAENARIPIDDPATHLELTMIHEVMVLDHSGPDLALIEYGSAAKLLVTSVLLVAVIAPGVLGHPLAVAVSAAMVAVVAGVIESMMARLRLPRVKQFLIGAVALGVVALASELLTKRLG